MRTTGPGAPRHCLLPTDGLHKAQLHHAKRNPKVHSRVKMNIYCPYSDTWVAPEQTSSEHIIPLSLGGDNRLTLPVQRELNSILGREIDGPLANEFLLLNRRVEFDARGHSGREPELIVKSASDAETGAPLQAIWGRKFRLWDPKAKQDVPLAGKKFHVSFKSKILDLSHRFVAKTFLSAGYLAYGDLFIRCVRHENARLVMKDLLTLQPSEAASIKARVYSPFTPASKLDSKQLEEFKLEESVCSAIKGSCIVLAPGPANLQAYVGLMGMYMGMINVPADTQNFPRVGDYDKGHAFIISNGRVLRWSYRRLLERLLRANSSPPASGP
jgi:hypothetical protein